MNSVSTSPSGELLPLFSKAASLVVVLLGFIIAVFWATNLNPFPHAFPGAVGQNPATALAYLLGGISLWQLAATNPGSGRRVLPVTLAGIVTFLGALELISRLFGAHIGTGFLPQELAGVELPAIRRMPPNTALALFVIGLALLLFDVQTRRGFVPAQALALFSGLLGLIALIGYSYGVSYLYQLGGAAPMSFGAALASVVFTLGFLAARPTRGIMTVITSRTNGGAVARRLLPMAVIMPWVLGGLLLLGEQSGYYQRPFSVSIFAVLSILIFSALTWWNAKLLYLVDVGRARSERRLAVQHRATQIIAESKDSGEATPRILASICETLGWQLGVMWMVERGGSELRCAELWSAPGVHGAFAETSRKLTFARSNGLPGRVWAAGAPEWVADLSRQTDCARASAAAQAGLRSGFGIPISLGHEVVGVMEFFTFWPVPPDQDLLELLGSVGAQVGLLIERSWAEQELRRTSANLERSNADLQQFAYVASHDLFEPLRMVTSYLQLLRERYGGKLDPQAHEFMRYAIDGAARMRALINDLLAYSRVDSRGASFEPVESDAALDAALSNLKVAIEETQAVIQREPLPRVRADFVQLTQLFQNLVGNGIKFHAEEPLRLQVRAQRKDNEWVFEVRDNGIGIEPKHFERIFVIFQRLHTRGEYSGTGIGLAICKKIVERHGGRIWVESAPGKGSAFYFTLPAQL